MKKLIELEKDHNIVVCDKIGCGYQINYEEGQLHTFLNKSCPKCGENLLTQKDYDDFMKLKKVINFINKWFSWITLFIPKAKYKTTEIHVHDGVNIKEIKNE